MNVSKLHLTAVASVIMPKLRNCARLALALLAIAVAAPQLRAQPVYTPYAFTNFSGLPGGPGDADGTGSAARFNIPFGMAADTAGNLYVADTGNSTIRKITPAGVVTTLAGSAGQRGTNDGTGNMARFNGPHGVAVDGAGNIYVADSGNATIRKITPDGVGTTLAGSAGQGGTNDGPGTAARFGLSSLDFSIIGGYYKVNFSSLGPAGVAADGTGNVYVADTGNHTIRKITPDGVVTTLAGRARQSGTNDGMGGAARFSLPSSVAADTAGNVYVADTWNNLIRKIAPDGAVTTLAGRAGQSGTNDGTGSAARFYYPYGVAVDRTGNVFVTDRYNATIRKISPTGIVTRLAGSAREFGDVDGIGSSARFRSPADVAVDSTGNLYVADTDNDRITKGIPCLPFDAGTGCPAPSFETARTFDGGFYPYFLTVGDLNGDGNDDLAVGHTVLEGIVTNISVLLGKGDGTFQPAVNYGAGGNPSYLAVGDFNGDENPDLAAANSGFGGVSILLGNGDGTFQRAVNYGTGTPSSVAVGDFNSDGKLDLATSGVSVLLGNGDGTFQNAVTYGGAGSSIAVGEFNGDGRLDLITANEYSDSISVLLGNGDGSFQAAVSYGVGSYPLSVALGDFNGDGKPDLAVANFGRDSAQSSVSVLLGNGDGTFRAAVYFGQGTRPRSVAVGDFNGDGKADLALSPVAVLLGNGDGTFQIAVTYSGGGGSVAVGDFNGDGKSDLAVTTAREVSVLLNTCVSAGVHLDANRDNTNLILSWPLPYTNFVLESATDLSSTNWQRVSGEMTTNNGRCQVTVPLDPGQRYFRLRKPESGTGAFPQSVVMGGSNGDSAPDLIVTNGYIPAVLRGDDVSILLTFDDLLPASSDVSGPPIPNGYGGLQWNNWGIMDASIRPVTSGYRTGMVSPVNVAYGVAAAIFSSGTPFSLKSGYLTMALDTRAGPTEMGVRVQGFVGTIVIYDNTYTVSNVAPAFINFDYLGVDRVVFVGSQNYIFVVDNLTVSLPPPDGGCTFVLSPRSRLHGPESQTGVVGVSTQVGCIWSVFNTNDWVTILSSLNNTNSGTVTYAVAAGPPRLGRSGFINIAGQNFEVSQSARPTGAPELLMFDDLLPASSGDSEAPIPNGYGGLQWNNWGVQDGSIRPVTSGYRIGMVSPNNVAYNRYGHPVSISSGTPFTLKSAYLTMARDLNAGPTEMHVRVQGSVGAAVIYDNTYTVSNVAPAFINFNYLGIDRVTFVASPSFGLGYGIVADNLTVIVVTDADGDGVPDDQDQCPDTALGALVEEHGCSINQLVPCAGPVTGGVWSNHGQYVATLAAAADDFWAAGLITAD